MSEQPAVVQNSKTDLEGLPLSYEFDVSLIVVATNVEVDIESFGEMIDAFRRVFHESNLKAEFIVIDDGIGGRFFESLQVLNQKIPNLRVIRFRRTFGESVVLRIATERAKGEFIITNTWYIQVKPEASLEVIKRLRDGADFVTACRHPRIDSLIARAQSWFFNVLTKYLTKVSFRDLNCSFRGFRKHVIDSIHFHGDLFRFVPVLAVGQGFRVEEIEVLHVAEKGPSTFLNVSLYLRRFLDIFSLFFLLKFIRKPLRFFGLTGLGLFFLGSALTGWVGYEKIVYHVGAVDRPLLVLGVLFMVLGPILLSIGLIGEIIIFTQGKTLADYHIGAILSGRDEEEGDREDQN